MANISITVPSDWTLGDNKDYRIDVRRPAGGQLILESGTLKDPVEIDKYVDNLFTEYTNAHADTTYCIDRKTTRVPKGPEGRSFALCFTGKTTSGQAIKVVAFFAVAVESGILYKFEIYAADALYAAAIDPIFDAAETLRWKLYQGE